MNLQENKRKGEEEMEIKHGWNLIAGGAMDELVKKTMQGLSLNRKGKAETSNGR